MSFLLSMGGDHSVSYPLLKAHANRYGPISLIQDSHSDTWAEPLKDLTTDRCFISMHY